MEADIAQYRAAHRNHWNRTSWCCAESRRSEESTAAQLVAACNLAIMAFREYDPRAKLPCVVSMVEGCEFHGLAASHEGSRSRVNCFDAAAPDENASPEVSVIRELTRVHGPSDDAGCRGRS